MMLPIAVAVCLVQGTDDNNRRVYDATVDSVVAVRATMAGGERSGSGVVLSRDGLLLVSYAVVPDGATGIRVWMKGPRLYRAEIVAASKRDEVTLLRIRPKGDLKPLAMGDSSKVKVGEIAYTLGNASNSMINNDQPSLNVGLLSGSYRLDQPRANAYYTGTVFETTAAVNVGMEGGPLLDAAGRMVGMITLNYSPHRFLGNAIPVNILKPVIERLKEGTPAATISDDEPKDEGAAHFGATAVDEGGRVVIESVEAGSPADASGLRKGVVVLGAGARRFKNAAEFAAFVKELQAGTLLTLSIDEDGLKCEVKVLLEKKK